MKKNKQMIAFELESQLLKQLRLVVDNVEKDQINRYLPDR